MGRTIIIEERVGDYIASLYGTHQWQLGLIIGQVSLNNLGFFLFGSQYILGLRPRDKAAMLVVDTKEIFLLNLHQNRVHFPAERNAFVLDHQHGRRDVTCKPAIKLNQVDDPRSFFHGNIDS